MNIVYSKLTCHATRLRFLLVHSSRRLFVQEVLPIAPDLFHPPTQSIAQKKISMALYSCLTSSQKTNNATPIVFCRLAHLVASTCFHPIGIPRIACLRDAAAAVTRLYSACALIDFRESLFSLAAKQPGRKQFFFSSKLEKSRR